MKNWTKLIVVVICSVLTWNCKNDSKLECGVKDTEDNQGKVRSEGETLFRENCASCHNRKLRDILTASPLGNVAMFRDSIYLLNVTKNFMKEVSKGNKVAICQWIKYNKIVMPSFENLEDSNIAEIYRFINEESKRLNITKEEMSATYECD